MTDNIACEAKKYLDSLPRIDRFEEHNDHQGLLFLLPREISYEVNSSSEITTTGLSPERDRKTRDLIRVIISDEPLHLVYRSTNVLTPLMYAESLPDILWHITTQAILYTKVAEKTLKWIRHTQTQTASEYGKHRMDNFWLTCSKPVESIRPGDYIAIFNRRVGGWDGSCERPVIELLGTGGHLPTVWDNKNQQFRTLDFCENLQKEAGEEIGTAFSKTDIHLFGGYNNELTHELVVLAGIEVPEDMLPDIQSYAIQNIDPNTRGIYLGTLPEVINYYRKDPAYFAGGYKAALTNFPNQIQLMRIVETFFTCNGII